MWPLMGVHERRGPGVRASGCKWHPVLMGVQRGRLRVKEEKLSSMFNCFSGHE